MRFIVEWFDDNYVEHIRTFNSGQAAKVWIINHHIPKDHILSFGYR